MDVKYLRKLLRTYRKIKKFYPYPGEKPKVGEIREFGAEPSFYALVVNRVKDVALNVYECIPLTELGMFFPFSVSLLFYVNKKTLIPLPMKFCLPEKALKNLSCVIARTNSKSIKKCNEYVKNFTYPENSIFAEYMQFESERIKELNGYAFLCLTRGELEKKINKGGVTDGRSKVRAISS